MTYWCIAFIALGFVFMYYGRDWPPLKGILDQLIRMLCTMQKGSKAIKVIKKVGKALWIILISYLVFLGLLSIADIAMCPVDYL